MFEKCCGILVIFLCGITVTAQIDTLYVCEPGDELQLEVEADAFAYLWSSASSLDNNRIHNPVAKPYVETTYIAEIISDVKFENLVINADFSEGNSGFISDYGFVKIIITQGVYGVDFSPADLNGVWFARCADHTDGEGQMLVVDGSPISNQRVWCQKIDVKPNTNYVFTAYLTSSNSENPAELKFLVNGEQVGNILTASEQVCQWDQFYGIWNSESTDSADICIVNVNVKPNGNDFALDDISFYELESVRYDTTVVIIEGLIAAEQRKVYIPNAFSPNGDQQNDRFEIFLGKGTEFIKEYRIYDLWGNRVYSSVNCVDRSELCFWDGEVNGILAANGTYIYVVKVLFTDKQIHLFKGDFQLLR